MKISLNAQMELFVTNACIGMGGSINHTKHIRIFFFFIKIKTHKRVEPQANCIAPLPDWAQLPGGQCMCF